MMRTLKIVAAVALASVMAVALALGEALAQTPSGEKFEGVEIYLDGSDTPADVDDALILGDGEVDGIPVESEGNRVDSASAWMNNAAWVLYLTAVFGFMFGVGVLIGRLTAGIALRRRRRS